jgi:non-canonical poly(A) RNA polymerase PAPD5/7
MQRARCCAANAYDATSAFQGVFGRATTSHHLRRPSNVCNELRTQNAGTHRSYSDSRTRKLAFYEELMASDPPAGRNTPPEYDTKEHSRTPKEEQVEPTGPWDARPGLSLLGEPLWKTRMIALSQHIRESKLPQPEKAPEEAADDSNHPKTLDYQGIAIRPEISKKHKRQRPPWAVTVDQRTARHTAAQILDAETEAFARHMLPTEKEQRARDAVRANVRRIMLSDFEARQVNSYHFGSSKTGLALPFSDIDLGVYDSLDYRNNLEAYMERLYQTFLDGKDYMLVVHRPPPNAIITAQHQATGIDVQIIAKGFPGKQDKYMERYLKSIPNLRALYTVVRTAFGTRGLVDPFIGGISAYGTSMMLVAALTRRGTPPEIHKSAAAQLLQFLSFWSNFDMTRYGISFPDDKTAKLFSKLPPDASDADMAQRLKYVEAARRRKDMQRAGQYRIGRVRPEQPYLLCLQDPASHINDLGARCHAIKHIQETIKVMHQELVRSMAEYDQVGQGSEKRDGDTIESLLMPLVGRSHEIYAYRRKRMVSDSKLKEPEPAPVQIRRIEKNGAEHYRTKEMASDEAEDLSGNKKQESSSSKKKKRRSQKKKEPSSFKETGYETLVIRPGANK